MSARKLDVRRLPGLRKETREHLLQAGIVTLDQLIEFQPEDLRQFKGIKSSAHCIHASARAFIEQKPIWYTPLPERCCECGIMFDLETNPATGVPWSLGWADGMGDVQVILVASSYDRDLLRLPEGALITLVPDHEEAWYAFADVVGDSENPIYHWSGFDAGVLRATGPRDVRDRLSHRMYDLLAAFNQTVRLPIENSSLKTVARYLDFSWSAYEDWWQAYQDYQHWLRSGDPHMIAQACSYQKDDVVALALVWQWLVENR